MALTSKQRLFVAEYVKDYNATNAAKRAGYSEKTAHSQGQRLLKNADVARAVERFQQRTEARAAATVDDVVRELTKIAFANLRDVASWDEHGMRAIASDELSEAAAASLSEIEERTDRWGNRSVSVKQHSKLGALAQLGKHLGMNSEKLDEKISDAVEEILTEIGARLPAQVYAQVLDAIRAAMGLAPMGRGSDDRTGGTAVN